MKYFLQSLSIFDRIVWLCIIIFSLLIGGIISGGDQTNLRISNFSWQDQQIGVQDRYFILNFNRPVDQKSVENNLITNPSLPGTISWKRGKLFYTLTELPIYGNKYELQLEGAKALHSNQEIEPFISIINTHDRAFVYIGIEGEERGKLVLCKIIQPNSATTKLEKILLTPGDIIITYFEIYPEGDRILFSAFDRNKGIANQQLYTVTTGLDFKVISEAEPVGRIKLVLAAEDYKNLKFDLSDNGKIIVVQRENHRNPADAGLWVIPETGKPRPLGIQTNEFMVSPDGKTLALSQDTGVNLIPLSQDSHSPQFLAGYEKIVGFSKDSQKKLLVRNNPNFTRSLVVINQQQETQEIFQTINPIVGCLFEPREEKTLYCLKTDSVPQEDGTITEEPFLSIIDLSTGQDLSFLALPNYQDVRMSMSPDGVALLFDQVVTASTRTNNDLVTLSGQAIADGRLWVLFFPEVVNEATLPSIIPKELNPGFKPLWLP
jgi:hypothetical protein